MKFATAIMAFVASATYAAAAQVTFKTLDDKVRTVYFTSDPGYANIDPVVVSNKEDTTVQFPDKYIGNYWAVVKGGKNTGTGMLGEVTFGGWMGKTYFDVSAIVVPGDTNNVKQMYPAKSMTPDSGCEEFPCDNAYYLPDDEQTKVTDETHLITTLGAGSVELPGNKTAAQ
ncbi:hypothetical protein NCS57_01140300 [Fusarium keratoplasticum]|uniref:Uncharacterized protein n=1 Tax=Fusarium keratoplasticum TaxID=1328300 RepID=A0ACC0QLL7_9HYPO|nr:hypothetical protein NCS57_01140300 [Fusarium keratoplasticum]KAI8657618.1 hypothetical protein NCS57_01140300 [Fusarium keratoplasticum]KAI8658582.1 hypothetical protein NCS55_01134900 [Fusarium keratoplasticum]